MKIKTLMRDFLAALADPPTGMDMATTIDALEHECGPLEFADDYVIFHVHEAIIQLTKENQTTH